MSAAKHGTTTSRPAGLEVPRLATGLSALARSRALRWLATLLCCATLATPASAAGLFDSFIDPEDGWVDGSSFLLDYEYSVLPVPIFITEPALGQGLGIAGVHFHDIPEEDRKAPAGSSPRPIPRSITAGFAGATNNDSWFAGGGHFGYFKRDSIRYEGFAGYVDVNLDFYGTATEEIADGRSFNAKGAGIFQQLAFRLGESNFFAGAAYLLVSTDITFDKQNGVDSDSDIPGVDPDDLDSSNAALALVGFYDSLDNQYTPRSGVFSDLRLSSFDETWGGDFDYDQYTWKNQAHLSLTPSWILGVRLDLDMIDGYAPFYGVPFIKLKGIPVLRYQGDKTVVSEARLSWEPHPRWQLSAFVGAGKAADDIDDLLDSTSRVSRGVGFRYMGVRVLGLNLGLDYARGPEESVVYISFGTRWL